MTLSLIPVGAAAELNGTFPLAIATETKILFILLSHLHLKCKVATEGSLP